jgi:hypothetical protein
MANNPNIIPPNLQEILGGFNRRITSFLTEENEILVDQFLMNNNIIIPANIDQSIRLMVKERFYNIVPNKWYDSEEIHGYGIWSASARWSSIDNTDWLSRSSR